MSINSMSSATQVTDYLETLTLPRALWWFIENSDGFEQWRTEVFFYLRERVRNGK